MTDNDELSPQDEALSEAIWKAVHEGLTAGVKAPDAVAGVVVIAGKMIANVPAEHRSEFLQEAMKLMAFHAGYGAVVLKTEEEAMQ